MTYLSAQMSALLILCVRRVVGWRGAGSKSRRRNILWALGPAEKWSVFSLQNSSVLEEKHKNLLKLVPVTYAGKIEDQFDVKNNE